MANANPTLFDYAQQEVECRAIPGLPGYRVGSDGSIWSNKWNSKNKHKVRTEDGWFEMAQSRFEKRYRSVRFFNKDRATTLFVHRLVLLAFAGPCPQGMEARHLDGNKHNNAASNLAWGTHKENVADMDRHGNLKRGSQSHYSKLIESDVLAIRQMLREKIPSRVIAKRFSVSEGAIRLISRGKTWIHVI